MQTGRAQPGGVLGVAEDALGAQPADPDLRDVAADVAVQQRRDRAEPGQREEDEDHVGGVVGVDRDRVARLDAVRDAARRRAP